MALHDPCLVFGIMVTTVKQVAAIDIDSDLDISLVVTA